MDDCIFPFLFLQIKGRTETQMEESIDWFLSGTAQYGIEASSEPTFGIPIFIGTGGNLPSNISSLYS